MKLRGRVETAETTPITTPTTFSGTQSIARIPSRSSTSRDAARGSVCTSPTRIATPSAATRPMIPSPTGIDRARHSSLWKPCAAAWTMCVRSLLKSPIAQPPAPMSAGTEMLIRSRTDATSRRAVMSWLVAWSAASSSARRRLSSARRHCATPSASGRPSSPSDSTSASLNARGRFAASTTAPRMWPPDASGTSTMDRKAPAARFRRVCSGTSSRSTSSTRIGAPSATTRARRVPSSGIHRSRGRGVAGVRGVTLTSSNSRRSASSNATVSRSNLTRLAVPAAKAVKTSSMACRAVSTRVSSLTAAARRARCSRSQRWSRANPSSRGRSAGNVEALSPPTRPSSTNSPTRRLAAPSGVRKSAAAPPAEAPGGTTRVSWGREAGVAARVVSHSRSAAGARRAPAVTTIGSSHAGRSASAPAVAPVKSTTRRRVVARPSAVVGAERIGVTRSRSPRSVFTSSRRRQQAARQAARMLTVLDHEAPVHEHVLDARRILVRLLVGRAVRDTTRVEDDEVGARAHRDDAPILEPEPPRRHLRHLVDRLRQREHALLACILAQNARKRSIAPGMWLANRQLAVRRERRAVGPDHDRRMRQRTAQIALVELEENHIPLAAFVDNQLEGRVDRVCPALRPDLRHALALGVLATGTGGDQYVLPPETVEQALANSRRLDVPPDPRALLGIGQSLEHGVDSALERPVGQERPERRARGRIRIDVRHHVEPLRSRGIDQLEGLGHLPPVGAARRLHVTDLDREIGFASDMDRLADRIQEGGALAPDMARVEAAVACGGGRERDHLVGRCERAGRVDEPGRETPRAVLDAVGDRALHPAELGRRRRAAREAHRRDPHGAVADQLDHVERGAARVERPQVVADRAPAKVHRGRNMKREPSKILEELRRHGRRREAAVADDLGGHTLAHLRLGPAVVPQAPVRVRVHVDEARGQHLARRVQVPARGLTVQIADGRDLVVLDPDVRAAPGTSGAVDDLGALDLQIKHGS